MQEWTEDRCNLDIDIIALPGWSDATSKIFSLLMGDETQATGHHLVVEHGS